MKLIPNPKSLFVLTALCSLVCSGCNFGEKGSGVAKVEDRQVADFSRISVSGSADVVVVVGGEKSVTVTFDDNLLKLVKTEVSGDTLKVYTSGGWNSSVGLTVVISIPSLHGVDVSGVSDITATNVKSDDFKVKASGTGEVKLSGTVEKLDVSVSGTADAQLQELKAKVVKVEASGTSDAVVHASQSVNASSSGTADIYVHGNPSDVTKSSSGVSDVEIVGKSN